LEEVSLRSPRFVRPHPSSVILCASVSLCQSVKDWSGFAGFGEPWSRQTTKNDRLSHRCYVLPRSRRISSSLSAMRFSMPRSVGK
jgi:hypothetical protein